MLEMSSTRTYEAHVYRKWPLITAYNCLVSELYSYRDSMGGESVYMYSCRV